MYVRVVLKWFLSGDQRPEPFLIQPLGCVVVALVDVRLVPHGSRTKTMDGF